MDAQEISYDMRVQLFALLKGRWDLLDESRQDKAALNPTIGGIVEEWLQYYIERPVRSLQLVKSVL